MGEGDVAKERGAVGRQGRVGGKGWERNAAQVFFTMSSVRQVDYLFPCFSPLACALRLLRAQRDREESTQNVVDISTVSRPLLWAAGGKRLASRQVYECVFRVGVPCGVVWFVLFGRIRGGLCGRFLSRFLHHSRPVLLRLPFSARFHSSVDVK